MAPTNQIGTVARIRSKYPTPLGAQHAAFLIEAARATGAKLLRKDAGSNIQLPSGDRVSSDFLIFDGFGIDILQDSEGAANPTWQEKGPTPGDYVDVGNAAPAPAPGPGDPDDRVAALERRVQRLESGSYRLVPE
jgi:hypothetical protein